jgi:hypothetical protein
MKLPESHSCYNNGSYKKNVDANVVGDAAAVAVVDTIGAAFAP